MDDAFKKVQFRMYHNKELPALVGIEKWTFAREIKRHKKTLGPKIGYHWRFEQVLMILKIYGVPYIVVS